MTVKQIGLLAMIVGISSAIAAGQIQQSPKLEAKAGPLASSKTEKAKQRYLDVEFENYDSDAKTKIDVLTKAVLTDLEEGTVFKTDKLTVDNNKTVQRAVSQSRVDITDERADITGDSADIQFARTKRIAVITGNIKIDVKPKKDDKAAAPPSKPILPPMPGAKAVVLDDKAGATKSAATDGAKDDEKPGAVNDLRKYPTTITCDKLEYEYAKEKKHALLTGSLKAVQKLPEKTRTLTAQKAEWFGAEDRLILFAPVHVEDTDGTVADSAQNVEISTKEGEEKIKMKRGKMTLPVHEDDEAPKSAVPNGPAKPGPNKAEDKKTEKGKG